ncbi:MAG: Isoquinoline 1-oxidoreductase beta subunit [Myxococcales bacterium]|nr:Isoquinoline 1-oxidoreductase beta subunit [Myxococcales bacterium]
MSERPVLITRRSFLIGLNLSAGGLALGIFPAWSRADEPSGKSGKAPTTADAAEEAKAPGLNPNPFVHVGFDGLVTIVCARSEMGQGVRSSLPVLIADELGATLARVKVVQADGDAKYGDQNTDGSSSVRNFFDDLRRAGATARQMLVAAAAQRWNVQPDTCVAHDHVVEHRPTKRTLAFGELSAAAAKLPIPAEKSVTLRPRAELHHLGKELPFIDAAAYVTGKAAYGADVRVPEMLIAVIARPPAVGGKVLHYDPAPALAVPGVKRVIALPAPKAPYAFQAWGGVAVLAENTWAAMRGRAALKITWDAGENGTYDSDAYRRELAASLQKGGTRARNLGDVDAALAKAARVIDAEYYVPHLPQMPMEPPVAMAHVRGDRCEIWASTQNPQEARSTAAKLLGVPEERVTIHVTFLGGGFGRKSKADFVSEAVLLSKEARVPVRVQWTREDDVRHAYYNAVSTQRLRAGLDGRGKVVAWLHRTAFPPIGSTFAKVKGPTAEDLQQGVLDLALDVPNVRAEACAATAHVRIGWYRSVYNIFHAFAISSFMDEIAHARGQDPRDVLYELIGPPRTVSLADLGIGKLPNYGAPLATHPVDAGRLHGVVQRVTELARWNDRKREGRALGLAAHRSFLSYAACVASVVRDPERTVRVDEAWLVLDAGTIVNLDRVRAQLQGAIAMGISNALFGGVTMKKGATQESNFRDARIAGIRDVPRKLHVEIISSDGPPCGVGEPGVPPVAPAIANAIFALTGQRIRELPLLRALRV